MRQGLRKGISALPLEWATSSQVAALQNEHGGLQRHTLREEEHVREPIPDADGGGHHRKTYTAMGCDSHTQARFASHPAALTEHSLLAIDVAARLLQDNLEHEDLPYSISKEAVSPTASPQDRSGR